MKHILLLVMILFLSGCKVMIAGVEVYHPQDCYQYWETKNNHGHVDWIYHEKCQDI